MVSLKNDTHGLPTSNDFGSCSCSFKITSNWTDTLFFFLEAYVAIFGDLDTRSFVTDTTADQDFRL